jgi:hypothetical protein
MFTNAIKFSQTNGNIQLFAEIIPDSTLKISIQDDGEGISPEYLPFVFERYTQEIPRNVGLSASTGIGLSFCKMAVELHGCKIGVSSEKGNGTTFWFTLPLAESHNPDAGKLQGIKMEPDNIAGFILSKEEKEFLLPYCRLLEQLSIYQLTEVKDIVKPIESNMPNIPTWKMLVLDSLAACNEASYRKLITLCHGKTL